jgi:hypothetical protein
MIVGAEAGDGHRTAKLLLNKSISERVANVL